MPSEYDDHVLRRKKPQPNPKPRLVRGFLCPALGR